MKSILIDGGIGKQIALSGVINRFAMEGEDVTVVSPHDWCFWHLPNIKKVYPWGTPYLFQDILRDTEIVEFDPYKHPHVYRDGGSIIEAGAKMLWGDDHPPVDEMRPVIGLGVKEHQGLKNYRDVPEHKNGVIFYQPFGAMGADGVDPSARSMPLEFAHRVADALVATGKCVYYVGTVPFAHDGVFAFQPGTTFRQIMATIPQVDLCVGVDSSLHHAAVACGKRPIVLWGSTSEKIFGYEQFGWARDIREQKCPDFIPLRFPLNDPEIDERVQYANQFGDYAFSEIMKNVV